MAFKFRPRSKADIDRVANESGGGFDSMFKEAPMFRPKEGDHRIRICPPTFDGARHYALAVYVHYEIGADKAQYICPQKMGRGDCPICEEAASAAAQASGDEEEAAEAAKYVKDLRAGRRSLVWVLDRSDKKSGPKLYDMPFTKVDKEINALSNDKETGETLSFEDPDDGYDIFFSRKGATKENTTYMAFQRATKATPLSRDPEQQKEWLAFLEEHPLDQMLMVYDYEHLSRALNGKATKKDDDDDGELKVKRRKVDEDDEEPRSKNRASDDDDDDEPKAKKRRASVDDDEEGEIDEPRGRPKMREEDDGETRRKASDDDDDDEPKAKKRRASVDDDDDGELKVKRRKVDDDDEDEAPKAKKRSSDDDEDDEPKAKKRVSDDDDEEPRRKVKVGRDEESDDDDHPRGGRSSSERSSRGELRSKVRERLRE